MISDISSNDVNPSSKSKCSISSLSFLKPLFRTSIAQSFQHATTSTKGPIKVLLVDDFPSLRIVLRGILEKDGDIQVVGECGDGMDVLPFLNRHETDVVIMDVRMPEVDGVEATRRIKTRYPDVDVIGFSNSNDSFLRSEICEAGAIGLVSKSIVPTSLVKLITQARQG